MSNTKSTKYSKPYEVLPKKKQDSSFIFLCGLGDSGQSYLPIGNMLQAQPQLTGTKFIFPNAPTRNISLNGGFPMPGWYDIYQLDDIGGKQDKQGIQEAGEYLKSLVEQEISNGIDSQRIIIGGFSQGGAVAFYQLRKEIKIGALIALSSYIPLHLEAGDGVVSSSNIGIPIFSSHGVVDQVINVKYGRMSRDLLLSKGCKVTYKEISNMGHEIDQQVFTEMLNFLATVMK